MDSLFDFVENSICLRLPFGSLTIEPKATLRTLSDLLKELEKGG
ncbi:MAG: hypothetical protein KatS3mg100_165 [Candidatus Parcubacteria bacterium]|nr:MAG: hypothetical protein KatS3mg100_165 [Candidatus Parcubacteria bacterium]